MLDLIPLAPVVAAFAGFAGGLYLACRFAWPRRVYVRVFGGAA